MPAMHRCMLLVSGLLGLAWMTGCGTFRERELVELKNGYQLAIPTDQRFTGAQRPGYVTELFGPEDQSALDWETKMKGYDPATSFFSKAGLHVKYYGFVNSRGRRLLDPEWDAVQIYSDTVIFAKRNATITRFDLASGPSGESIIAITPTEFREVDSSFRCMPDPRAICGQDWEKHVVSPRLARATGKLMTLDAKGEVTATFPWPADEKESYRLPGGIVIITSVGLSLIPLAPEAKDAITTNLVELSYVRPRYPDDEHLYSWSRRGQLLAYRLPVDTKAGVPLFWPMDPLTCRPRSDDTGKIVAYEPTGYVPRGMHPFFASIKDRVSDIPPGQFDHWIVHYETANGPRLGLETPDRPDRRVSTGPVFMTLEQVPWDAGKRDYWISHTFSEMRPFPKFCFIAERPDHTWVRISLEDTGGGSLQLTQSSDAVADRASAIALHDKLVKMKIDENEVIWRDLKENENKTALERKRYHLHAFLENGTSWADEAKENALTFGGAELLAYAKKTLYSSNNHFSIEDIRRMHADLSKSAAVSAEDKAWMTTTLNASEEQQRKWEADAPRRQREELERARIEQANALERAKVEQASAQAERQAWAAELRRRDEALMRAAHHNDTVNSADVQNGGPANAPDTYYQDSQRRQKYSNELDRYNHGQQNWAPAKP